MKFDDIRALMDAKVLAGWDNMQQEVKCACSSDMMSDVLAFPKDQMALLTGLVNTQVMRTADMLDVRLVVFVRGKQPPAEVISMANENGVTVLATDKTLYTASGILYAGGLMGGVNG